MIKIMKATTWELIKADLAQAKRERDEAMVLLGDLSIIKKILHHKKISMNDLLQGRAHISWNPKHAPKLSFSGIKGAMRPVV
jgi:hypothetical protein